MEKESVEMEMELDVSEELKEFKDAYLAELRETGHASPQTKFNFAWSLTRSSKRSEIKDGVALLKELHEKDPYNREYLYYLSMGMYKLQTYVDAKEMALRLLEIEPKNRQALALLELIESRINRDGVIGMAIVGGVLALAAGAFFVLKK
eukprot:GCRY01001222.1.p1 GENE.GCRY01001222.1~~GCRY01001222.1.p1  ORF type:complete len:149 (+),score=33.02 GCRY01001222.1:110-556(+)